MVAARPARQFGRKSRQLTPVFALRYASIVRWTLPARVRESVDDSTATCRRWTGIRRSAPRSRPSAGRDAPDRSGLLRRSRSWTARPCSGFRAQHGIGAASELRSGVSVPHSPRGGPDLFECDGGGRVERCAQKSLAVGEVRVARHLLRARSSRRRSWRRSRFSSTSCINRVDQASALVGSYLVGLESVQTAGELTPCPIPMGTHEHCASAVSNSSHSGAYRVHSQSPASTFKSPDSAQRPLSGIGRRGAMRGRSSRGYLPPPPRAVRALVRRCGSWGLGRCSACGWVLTQR